jgi:hypothetical protein
MSVGPLGFFGSIAGAPQAQRNADVDRAQHDAARHEGEVKNDALAEKAAGIGKANGDELDINERDAAGRRPWEIDPNKKKQADGAESASGQPRQIKDMTGTTGGQLDLTG